MGIVRAVRIPRIVKALALGAAAAAVGAAAMGTSDGRLLDEEMFDLANAQRHPVDSFFPGVTELGSLYGSAAAAASLALLGRPREAARAIAAAGTTWLLLQGIKQVVDRPRPFLVDAEGTRRLIAPPPGTSWPSAHPAVLTTFTTVAGRELGLGRVARVALQGVNLTVAISRMYVGVHYPSDVTSGYLIGRAVAAAWPQKRGR